jgi:peptidoglycan/LPS O-acetylase OafA/YrhL
MEGQLILANGDLESPLIAGLWQNGFAGVDLFFVISGFIMVYVSGEAKPGLRTAGGFLFARAARIYPLWWVFAGVFTAYMLYTYGLTGVGETGLPAIGRGIPPFEYLAKSFALIPQAQHPVLGVGWTLIHEMYFYVAFAVILLAPRRLLPALLFLWGALVTIGALTGLSAPVATTLLELATYPMTLEFIFGAVAGLLVCSGRRLAPLTVSLIAIAWLIAALSFVLPPEYTPGPDAVRFGPFAWADGRMSTTAAGSWTPFILTWGRVLFFGLPCALLVYGFASLEADGRFKAWPFMVRLGDWSYALYLSHMLVFAGLARILPSSLAPGQPGILDNAGFIVVALALAIIVSGLSFHLFETPLMRVFGRLRSRLFSSDAHKLKPRPVRARVW